MSEPRKNHLNLEGGQVKEDEHIATYKPIPESETAPPPKSLSKSREKVSSDGAEEKLLAKEAEARVTARVDMADATYVHGDHRNGGAQIELDANRRQFAGLTKEELMRFADDPFWVRVRWAMFVAFWLLWLCMLAGAVAIIYTAPKCARPPPKMWLQKGPLVDATPATAADLLSYKDVMLKNLQEIKTQGVFVSHDDAYAVLDDPSALDQVKGLVAKAKEYGVRVIVELKASFVSSDHVWFQRALNRTGYEDYFVFTDGTGTKDENGRRLPPNWVSQLNSPAFKWSDKRSQYYYHLLGEDKPQLNFNNPEVVKQFDEVLKKFMQAGVAGVRLLNARELIVNSSLPEELQLTGSGVDRSAGHTDYRYWQHRHSVDQTQLDQLLTHWAHVVDTNALVEPTTGNTVFTIFEDGSRPELFLLGRGGALRPPSAAPRNIAAAAAAVADLQKIMSSSWPALKLTKADGSSDLETAAFSMLLPASPVLPVKGFESNETISQEALSEFGKLAALRQDASIEHGSYRVVAAPAAANTTDNTTANSTGNTTGNSTGNSTGSGQTVLVCARWKTDHTGYAAVWNSGSESLLADLSGVEYLPERVTLYYAGGKLLTVRQDVPSDKVPVPAESTVVVSYVLNFEKTKR